jgi:c-di-GMP-binding flagellar brake protein YcgR
VPANRSRTQEWRRCLRQVHERNGALEIAVDQDVAETTSGSHLVWRVRLLSISDTEIIVEQPMALGHTIPIEQGIQLIAILSIGQNRWMFNTTNLGSTNQLGVDRKPVPALRLVMPESVQRCQRRNYYRVETAALSLPEAEIWPLLDPKSVLIAERAYELQYEIDSGRVNPESAVPAAAFDEESVMPEVGPKFSATLLNLGGGGVGLRIKPHDGQTVARHKLFWIRIALPEGLNTPICASAKLVHTHIESNHDIYAGLAFDFTFNPGHQRFVVDQICRYIALQQKAQHRREERGQVVPEQPIRRSA